MTNQLLTSTVEGVTEQWQLIANVLEEVGFDEPQRIEIAHYFVKSYGHRCKTSLALYSHIEAEAALQDAISWVVEKDELPPSYASGELRIKFLKRRLH